MYLSAIQASRAIANKDISCREYMRQTLQRIEAFNPVHNAIVELVDAEDLLKQARQADEALARGEYWGWMHGLPHAVKDLANLEGFVTSFGSPVFANTIATEDDLFVERIRQQGAIFIGKTNVPEFGLGSQTYNPVYGPTRNAFDINLTAGGSSGGAAVALATGMLPVADGSDMMGSLRNPAGYNNIAAIRPSLGRVPRAKQDLFFNQLSTEGPMGRTIEDVIQLFTTLAGASNRSPLSVQEPVGAPDSFSMGSLKDLKIGWLADYDGYLAMQPGVLELCEASLKNLETAGAIVTPASIDFDMASLWQCWLVLRQWMVAGGRRLLYENPTSRELLKPELIWEIEQSFNLTAAQVTDASSVRSDWYRAVNQVFTKWDILALPSAQVFPFPVEEHWPSVIDGNNMDTYHRWMEVVIGGTLSGCPVVALPAGFRDGAAMGIQFIAPIGQDKMLLEFALAYEEVNNWHAAYQQFEAGELVAE
ncbi:MAG: amidase [bacterium]